MITVIGKFKELNHVYMYCGRGTPLGNPFPMKTERDRDKVCNQYEDWFNERLQDLDDIRFHEMLNKIIILAKIQDVYLGCHCAPKRCHCDIIKSYVENQI